MWLSAEDWQALCLSAELALVVSLLLLVIATPLAWWLARSQHWATLWVSAVVMLPLVLPPTVLGYYMLVSMAPQGWLGQTMAALGLEPLPFTFAGLVLASCVYSLPFMVQPLRMAFARMDEAQWELAQCLGKSGLSAFWRVALPQARLGYVAALLLTFVHTLGEFGVVLMLGGNIPGETRVAAVQLYDHVESMHLSAANALAMVLTGTTLLTLLLLHTLMPWSKSSLRST